MSTDRDRLEGHESAGRKDANGRMPMDECPNWRRKVSRAMAGKSGGCRLIEINQEIGHWL